MEREHPFFQNTVIPYRPIERTLKDLVGLGRTVGAAAALLKI